MNYNLITNQRRKYFLLWSISSTLLTTINCYSQNSIQKKYYDFSQKTKKKVSKAHITLFGYQNKVVISDSLGLFNIKKTWLKNTDSIKISALGYQTLTLYDLKETTYYLEEHIELLDEVILSTTKKKYSNTTSLFNKLNKRATNLIWNGISAVYIPQSKKNKKIKNLLYRVVDFRGVRGIQYLPFKANIYSVDPKTGLPGKPILNDIITKKKYGQKWAKVPIVSYNITIPKEGIFVILKVLDQSEYELDFLQSDIGIIEAVPALLYHKYDPNYIRKSYRYTNYTYYKNEGYKIYPKKAWRLQHRHYLIDVDY